MLKSGEREKILRLLLVTYCNYQSRLIADLPGAYLGWVAHTSFPQSKPGRLLVLMLKLDRNGLSSLLDPLRPR